MAHMSHGFGKWIRWPIDILSPGVRRAMARTHNVHLR